MRLTYSNVVSSLCLCLLVGGGTAFAASELGKEAVGTRELAKEAVTPSKLSKAAKSTLDKGGASQGPKGAAGATGPQGPPGPPGAAAGAAGVALAGVTSDGTGANPSTLVWFNRFGGAPTIHNTTTGIYSVSFPGLSASVNTNVIAVTNSPTANEVTVSSGNGVFVVQVRTPDGLPASGYFSFVVFAASPAG